MIKNIDELNAALEAAHNECLIILNGSLGQTSGTLYHYTDLNACLSILEHKTLRFTDVRYCNDPEEIDGGLKILNKVHDELMPMYLKLSGPFAYLMSFIVHTLNLATSFEVHDKALLQKAYADIRKCGLDPSKFTYAKSSVFVACLSEKNDDLRQWMPYADDGRGVAIGFKGLNGTHDLIAEESWILKVCYKDVASKEQYVKNIYDRAFKIFNSMDLTLIGVFANQAYGALLMDVIACKSDNYEDEDEWRIIKIYNQEEANEKLKFRIRDNIIRPYVDIPIIPDSILEIVTGPKVEKILNSHALGSALKRLKYKNAVIKPSEISYR